MSAHGCSQGLASPAVVVGVLIQILALAMPAVAVPPVPAAATLAASGRPLTGLAFFTVPPCRIVDTRAYLPLLPGVQFFQLAGHCGIPACASAVSANLTVVEPQSQGYLTAYAGDAQLPTTSNLNFSAGQVRANSAIVQLADDGAGTVGVYYAGTASANLIVDVNGYFESTPAQSGTIVVDSVAPAAQGITLQGMIRIYGQGFEDPVAVTLAGVAAYVLCASGTEIQVAPGFPTGAGCSDVQGPVHVTNLGSGDSADGPQFTYLNSPPALVSVSPSDVFQSGGTFLSFTGSFPFGNQTGVLIGQQAASPDANSTTTTLYVPAPPFTGTFPTQPCYGPGGETGTQEVPVSVDVTLTNPIISCSSTAHDALTYLPNDGSCHLPPPPPPVAAFIASTGVDSNTTTFIDTSTGSPTSWSWDFGDGASTHLQNPVHTYSAAGTYVVMLTACNLGGCSTASLPIIVPGQ
jgi:hypothetical protein